MRVGIIGGGAAGLASAWLLEHEHEVTLFEKDDRFGGHAHTVTIEVDGRSLDVDAGFQFFAPGAAYATFNRLLDILDVPRRSYPATLTVYDAARQRPVVMPPLRDGRPVWSSFTPRALGTLIRFRRFLADVPAFLAKHDRTLTIGEYLERQRLPREFVDDFLLPAAARVLVRRAGRVPAVHGIQRAVLPGREHADGPARPRPERDRGRPEGLRRCARRVAGHERRSAGIPRSHASPAIRGGWTVEDADGERHTFDQVVIATNARQALQLLDRASRGGRAVRAAAAA